MSTTQDYSGFHPIPAATQEYYPPPHSTATCRLSVMSVGTLSMPGKLFVQGYKGDMDMRDWAFLIEGVNGQCALWDLGLRKGLAYNEKTQQTISQIKSQSTHSTADLLKSHQFDISSINTVFISHFHFDHIGDFSDFKPSTDLFLGPRSSEKEVTNASIARSIQVNENSLAEHTIRFMDDIPQSQWIDVGCFKGIDFWGDGSLYIIETPGHSPGHISALVRTHSSPDVFHLLGGDVAHHISLIDYERPSAIGVFPKKDNPMGQVSEAEGQRSSNFEDDIGKSYETMSKIARMDQEQNINVWLAHDSSLGPFVGEDGSMLSLDGGIDELESIKSRSRNTVG